MTDFIPGIYIAFTQNGPLLGDFEGKVIQTRTTHKVGELGVHPVTEVTGYIYQVRNPVIINLGSVEMGMFPFFQLTGEEILELPESEIQYNRVYEPNQQIRNLYSQKFGSGIQLIQ